MNRSNSPNLLQRLSSFADAEVIAALESPNDWTSKAMMVFQNLRHERKISNDSAKEMANAFWLKRIDEYLHSLAYYSESSSPNYCSCFLSASEMAILIEERRQAYNMSQRDLNQGLGA